MGLYLRNRLWKGTVFPSIVMFKKTQSYKYIFAHLLVVQIKWEKKTTKNCASKKMHFYNSSCFVWRDWQYIFPPQTNFARKAKLKRTHCSLVLLLHKSIFPGWDKLLRGNLIFLGIMIQFHFSFLLNAWKSNIYHPVIYKWLIISLTLLLM